MSRIALIIGMSDYEHLDNRPSFVNDAQAMVDLLRRHSDFDVRPYPPVLDKKKETVRISRKQRIDAKDLKEELGGLFLPKGPSIPDTALVYFSGHGLSEGYPLPESYLATSGAKPDSEVLGLNFYWLHQLLKKSSVRQKIVWLDCCFSGEVLNFDLAFPPHRGAGRDHCFIAASAEHEKAYETIDGKHGVLTQHLLDALDPEKQPDGEVSASKLVDIIQSKSQSFGMQRIVAHTMGEGIILTRGEPPIEVKREIPPKSTHPVEIPCVYKEWVIDHCRYMDIDRLREKGRVIQVNLPEIFVTLYAHPPVKEKKHHETSDIFRDQEKQADIEDLIEERASLLIEGQPGSGKTTLIKHFTYCMVSTKNREKLSG